MKSELDSLPPVVGLVDVKPSGVPEVDRGQHYRYQYNGINLDPFRIAQIYNITNMAQFTALKKILCAGNRGHKDLITDIDDIICAMNRWKQMIHEDIINDSNNTN